MNFSWIASIDIAILDQTRIADLIYEIYEKTVTFSLAEYSTIPHIYIYINVNTCSLPVGPGVVKYILEDVLCNPGAYTNGHSVYVYRCWIMGAYQNVTHICINEQSGKPSQVFFSALPSSTSQAPPV